MLIVDDINGSKHLASDTLLGGRTERIRERLALEFPDIPRLTSRRALEEDILRVHDSRHYNQIAKTRYLRGQLFGLKDLAADDYSWSAIEHAAGAGLVAVDAVRHKRAHYIYCNIAPAGHHATVTGTSGFCFFNNIAITAYYARQYFERVLIWDFDIHHGNGTQAIIEKHLNQVFLVSMYGKKKGFFPGTPKTSGPLNLNIPVRERCTSEEYLELHYQALEKVRAWNPDLVLLSAGFDAHIDDPLGFPILTAPDYGLITKSLTTTFKVPIISLLEGGYGPELATCVIEHIRPWTSPK